MSDWIDERATQALAYLLGYDETEIGDRLNEEHEDYSPDVASDLAYLTSVLRDVVDEAQMAPSLLAERWEMLDGRKEAAQELRKALLKTPDQVFISGRPD